MKRKILFLTLLLPLILTSCKSSNVILDVDYEKTSSSTVFTNQEIDEFHNVMYPDSYTEKTSDLESEILDSAEVKVGKYKKNSEVIDCTISALDLYTYLTDNQEKLMELDEENLYKTIHNAIENKEMEIRTVTISLPIQKINGDIVVSTDTNEYRDAVSGGAYSALSDLYAKIINDVKEEQK